MSAEITLTSDVIGLITPASFSRRAFMTASAAVAAGYTLAAGPMRAEAIKTDTAGRQAGDAKIKVSYGEMPGCFAEMKAPVLGLYGADSGIPVAQVEALKAALAANHKTAEFKIYPGAPHGLHADYRTTYRKEAAEDAWNQMQAWFRKYNVLGWVQTCTVR